jgi:hypothetical protein
MIAIIPKPLHIVELNFKKQTDMKTTMLWCSAHNQLKNNELEEKED